MYFCFVCYRSWQFEPLHGRRTVLLASSPSSMVLRGIRLARRRPTMRAWPPLEAKPDTATVPRRLSVSSLFVLVPCQFSREGAAAGMAQRSACRANAVAACAHHSPSLPPLHIVSALFWSSYGLEVSLEVYMFTNKRGGRGGLLKVDDRFSALAGPLPAVPN